MGNLLIGLWLYTSVIYQGQEMQIPNPQLQLQMIFVNSTQMKLHYSYTDESGFCESVSEYKYDETQKILHLNLIETHPENAEFCQKDPDMTPGNKTMTPVYFKNGKLHFELALDDDKLTLVLERQ